MQAFHSHHVPAILFSLLDSCWNYRKQSLFITKENDPALSGVKVVALESLSLKPRGQRSLCFYRWACSNELCSVAVTLRCNVDGSFAEGQMLCNWNRSIFDNVWLKIVFMHLFIRTWQRALYLAWLYRVAMCLYKRETRRKTQAVWRMLSAFRALDDRIAC